MCSSTTSRTLSTKAGSVDSLNASALCGAKPNARQMRDTMVWLMPICRAMARVDQCVAPSGRVSSVRVISRSTSAPPTVRGAPGRGASPRPWSPVLKMRGLRSTD